MYSTFPMSGSTTNYHQALQEDLVSLRCPRYAIQLMTGLLEVLCDSHLQDVTLVCCDGRSVRTNKLLLAASSQYFRQVLTLQGSELFLPGITSEVLNILLVFMFRGDVHVSQHLLPHVMHAAATLQIKGFQAACALIPNDLSKESNHKEYTDVSSTYAQPSKKRKLDVGDNILDTHGESASLFRPWKASSVSMKENLLQVHKPTTLNSPTLAADVSTSNTFVVPTQPSSPTIIAKPMNIHPSQIGHASCVSPNTSLDFSPPLASTMRNHIPTQSFTSPVCSTQSNKLSVNITPTSPIGLSSALENTKDFSTPLSGTLERILSATHSTENLMCETSPMSRLNLNDYTPPISTNLFTTPVSKQSYSLPVQRTPMELVKANPSSAAEVLCGSKPLFDDSKDGTVVEYRDESDDEGNLVIDLEVPIE